MIFITSGCRGQPYLLHAVRDVLARATALPGQSVALAVLLERKQLALLRIGLELVEAGNGPCGVAKGRMTGDVADPLRAEIDFERDTNGKVGGLTLKQRGQVLRGERH